MPVFQDRVSTDAQKKRADRKFERDIQEMREKKRSLEKIRDQVGAPMPDATPPDEDETVQQYEVQLKDVRETLDEFIVPYENAVKDAETRVEDAESTLVETKVKADMDEADESDVETAENALDAAESELEQAEAELEEAKEERLKLTRKQQIIEDRLSEARQEAQIRYESEIRDAVTEQTRKVVAAMEEARKQAERLFVMHQRLPVRDLRMGPRVHWKKLPIQPTVHAKSRVDLKKLFASLDIEGVEVPEFEAKTYTPPVTEQD